MSSVAGDLVIDEVLDELGFVGDGVLRQARAVIEAAGLTNGRKTRIAAAKRSKVEQVLRATFTLLCSRSACRQASASTANTVLDAARPIDCEVCGGSANTADVERAVAVLGERGVRRVVIVGGSPSTREELTALIADRLQLRVVCGTDRRTGRDAKADLAWADLVVIWGSTELDHKVSKLYTDASGARVVTCPKRGVAAMAATLALAAASVPVGVRHANDSTTKRLRR